MPDRKILHSMLAGHLEIAVGHIKAAQQCLWGEEGGVIVKKADRIIKELEELIE